jgi:hypothetical protein
LEGLLYVENSTKMRPSVVAMAGIAAALGVAAGQVKTGPEVGSRIPAFELADQHGRRRAFDNLRGPNGLVLTFVRSADW